ncbi:hypothetical protein OPIT5_04665 [Opitutaceae bacterium TAV5]|nr:hypothetical protein OPIT5_04665 [Opitutaceae bacterium TAV5]
MSNAPGQLTQFQQKAQLRLQEMEVEWRRTLFERFRHICREEMMDVMKTLLDTMHTPQALEQKLEELRRTSEMAQDGMQTMLARTCEEVQGLATKLDSQTTIDTAPLAAVTKETSERQEQLAKQTMSQQEKTSKLIQEDVRKSAEVMRKAVRKASLLTAGITIVVFLGAIAALKFVGGGFNLVSNAEMTAQRNVQKKLEQEIAQKTLANGTLEEKKDALETEIRNLEGRRDALLAEMKQTTGAQREATANLAATQRLVSQLQQVEDQFRFKLVKGEDGGVFVEIPEDAKPFLYQDRNYIQVK